MNTEIEITLSLKKMIEEKIYVSIISLKQMERTPKRLASVIMFWEMMPNLSDFTPYIELARSSKDDVGRLLGDLFFKKIVFSTF